MNREIYTYTDLTKLKESSIYQKIKHYPQITVSADLRKGLNGTIERDYVEGLFSGDDSVYITEFHSVAQAFNKDWGTDQSKFNEMIILSEYIRQRMDEVRQDKRQMNWLTG